jgi:small subunit ribosomal protein S17e
MGRIKTQFIKRITNELIEEHEKDFTKDFEKNKELVSKFTDTSSKKIRNIIAGYVTRRMRMKGKQE